MMRRSIVTLGSAAFLALAACAGPAPSTYDEDLEGDGDETKQKKETKPAGTETETPATPTAPTEIAPAKIHDASVLAYAVTRDALFVATPNAVLKAGVDGASPAPVAALAGASLLATDGVRVFGAIDRGATTDVVSAKIDGSDFLKHGTWNETTGGVPSTLSVNQGRVFVSGLRGDPLQSRIEALPTAPPTPGVTPVWQFVERVDVANVPPVFHQDRLLTLDRARASAVVRIEPFDTIDVVRSNVPTGAGAIATDGVDVYSRTEQGIVKAPVGAPGNSLPVIVVSSVECPVTDPASATPSTIEDALVVEGSTIFTACRVGANVEVRSFGKDGKLIKTLATAPWAGGLRHLRATEVGLYWMRQTNPALPTQNELWRAPKQ